MSFFPHFFFVFSCIYRPLNSHPISFLKKAHMLRAHHFFFFSFTVNVRHICLIFVISFSHSNLSSFFYTLHFRRFHFQRFTHRHFIFTFKCFIFFVFTRPPPAFWRRPTCCVPTIFILFFHRQRSAHLFNFRHFIFTFKYFIFLFSLAHQSYTSRRTSHSFSFNSFIQPHSNTSFNSIHILHSFSSGLPRHLVGDSFPVVSRCLPNHSNRMARRHILT